MKQMECGNSCVERRIAATRLKPDWQG